MIICFDGLDGCGKSTLIRSLYSSLSSLGYSVKVFDQPSFNTSVGITTRDLLAHPPSYISSDSLDLIISYMACADRLIMLEEIKKISQDHIVLVSRYILSTIAYGCSAFSSLQGQYLLKVLSIFPEPDIYFYLDISPELSLSRITSHRSPSDFYENINKLSLVYKNYLSAIKYFNSHFSNSIVELSAFLSPSDLLSLTLNHIIQSLPA